MVHIKEGTDSCRKETDSLRQESGVNPTVEVRRDRRDREYILFYKNSPVLCLGKTFGRNSVFKVREYFRELCRGDYVKAAKQALKDARERPLEEKALEDVRVKLYDDRHSDERVLRRPVSVNVDREKWFVK